MSESQSRDEANTDSHPASYINCGPSFKLVDIVDRPEASARI